MNVLNMLYGTRPQNRKEFGAKPESLSVLYPILTVQANISELFENGQFHLSFLEWLSLHICL